MKKYSLNERIKVSAKLSKQDFLNYFNINKDGLSKSEIEIQRINYGSNHEMNQEDYSLKYRFIKAFINPFSIVLLILALIDFITLLIGVNQTNNNKISLIIILIMLIVSGVIRFIQEFKSKKVTDKLIDLVNTQINVCRDNEWELIENENLVVFDHIKLKAGEYVPADIRIIKAHNCLVSQSAITGESAILQKDENYIAKENDKQTNYQNMIYLGSMITNGDCEGIVMAVGPETIYGSAIPNIKLKKNGFDKGSNSIAWVLIKFMCILVPIVFLLSGITKGNWLTSFLFSISVAVGLTPELLPMVITACLAKGSFNMGQKQTIVKSINAMQAFGSMDVLCIDKTGTLTGDTLKLEYYMDILGNEDDNVLNLAFLNSYYTEGMSNHLDNAILKIQNTYNKELYYQNLINEYQKLDFLAFDYDRKMSSVLLKYNDQNIIVAKGDVKNIIKKSKYIKYKDQVYALDDHALDNAYLVIEEMLNDGMKVLAIATKQTKQNKLNKDDENDLTLIGFIAFFDAPKKSSKDAISKFKKLNVSIKVLTGDNMDVALSICRRIGIDTENIITGDEFENLSTNEIQILTEKTTVFAELTPKQKADIINVLQSDGHTVGFLGDGVNDLPAILEADVGISVDNAVKSCKELADVILLKKDLSVLEEGIVEGRKSFANMSKYIKITASSNLGNILSIVIASLFLPFLPMTSIQLLLLNLLYDILCLSLPWDHVDDELCSRPLEWSGSNLSQFMLFFGPISTVFDILCFIFLMVYLCPMLTGASYNMLNAVEQIKFTSIFQTGWFLESMWTQVLILHLLRTEKIPFMKSKPSKQLSIVTFVGIIIFTILAMSRLGNYIGMSALPFIYFIFLFIIVILYLLTITIAKKVYINKHRHLI